MPALVLLRHGQSQWNLENRFTGWVDVNLTAQGEAEAKKGGRRDVLLLIARNGTHLFVPIHVDPKDTDEDAAG